jgi:Sec-independent protein translocase protein TatA
MQNMMANVHFLAFPFSGAEWVLALLIVVILFWSNRILDFVHGLRRAICEFRKASRDLARGFDQAGFDAGQSLGGIHGKTAAEALTTDNQTVGLYDPAVWHNSVQIGQNSGSEKAKMKNAIIRKLFFVTGALVFGVLTYRLYKLVFLNSN